MAVSFELFDELALPVDVGASLGDALFNFLQIACGHKMARQQTPSSAVFADPGMPYPLAPGKCDSALCIRRLYHPAQKLVLGGEGYPTVRETQMEWVLRYRGSGNSGSACRGIFQGNDAAVRPVQGRTGWHPTDPQ